MLIDERIVGDVPFYSFNNGILTMTGKVFPNDAREFWKPIIRDIEEFMLTKKSIMANFKFDYYNTASLLYIDAIMRMFADYQKVAKVIINWYYFKNDEDLQIVGEDYRDDKKISNFNLIQR